MYSDCNAFVHLKLWLIDWLIDRRSRLELIPVVDRICCDASPLGGQTGNLQRKPERSHWNAQELRQNTIGRRRRRLQPGIGPGWTCDALQATRERRLLRQRDVQRGAYSRKSVPDARRKTRGGPGTRICERRRSRKRRSRYVTLSPHTWIYIAEIPKFVTSRLDTTRHVRRVVRVVSWRAFWVLNSACLFKRYFYISPHGHSPNCTGLATSRFDTTRRGVSYVSSASWRGCPLSSVMSSACLFQRYVFTSSVTVAQIPLRSLRLLTSEHVSCVSSASWQAYRAWQAVIVPTWRTTKKQ